MRLVNIAPNCHELEFGGEDRVLFSYATPVACRIGNTFIRTEEAHSSTTTKHINAWLPRGSETKLYPQEWFDSLGNM